MIFVFGVAFYGYSYYTQGETFNEMGKAYQRIKGEF